MSASIELAWLTDPEVWASLLTLVVLEIVLGVDNLVFIAVLANKLPDERARDRARKIGLALALVTRLGLLASIAWLMRLTAPLFEILGHPVSWRDLILLGGGLFLIFKSTREIHDQLEGEDADGAPGRRRVAFSAIVAQIVVLDVVFSLDSVITAVGMASDFWIMATAVTIAVGIMLWASGPAARFVTEHPAVKMLALSFLLLIGTTLIADGAGFHVPKGYIYVAIAFSILVESLNQIGFKRARARRRAKAANNGAPAQRAAEP